ncbi:MAG: hypothetical protein MJ250_02785 [Alphaproteobacteria bacterium]|nr:hypothetical protein [Alphaproteobacteria bacterium]
MITKEDMELRGSLFANRNKENEKAPDFYGSIWIEGVKYRLAGWNSWGKNSGKEYVQLKAEIDQKQEV